MPADVLHAFFTMDAYIVAGLNSEAGITSRQTKVSLTAGLGRAAQGCEVSQALRWGGGSRGCGATAGSASGSCDAHALPSQENLHVVSSPQMGQTRPGASIRIQVAYARITQHQAAQ